MQSSTARMASEWKQVQIAPVSRAPAERNSVELSEYIRIALHRGWIAVVLAVLVAGVAYAYSERQTPVYEASLTIVLRPSVTNWDLGQSVLALLRSLAGEITTYSYLEETIARWGLEGITADTLLSGRRLEVVPDPGTFAIAITVRDPDPRLAANVANAIADLFSARRAEWNRRQYQDAQIVVEIPDAARVTGIYSPNTKIYVAAGGILGAGLGAAIMGILEWREAAAVRVPQDLAQLEIPLLGVIPPERGQRPASSFSNLAKGRTCGSKHLSQG
jgi:uncharacterized protein involved in exopolysaccharide biosynthesis